MSKIELKPCPFCGDMPYFDREELFCDCGVRIKFDQFIYSGEARDRAEARELAMKIWNERV